MAAEPLDKLDVLESDLRLILQKQPDNANALNALGYTLTDRTDRHDEAFVLIQKAVDIAPKNAFYLDSLGWVYYKLGDLENAEKYLQEAVAIQGDAEFLAHLGEVIWERGRHEEAKQIWLKAKQLSKDNKILLETMSRYGQ
jgi:Flp pilus assembly protein TadD